MFSKVDSKNRRGRLQGMNGRGRLQVMNRRGRLQVMDRRGRLQVMNVADLSEYNAATHCINLPSTQFLHRRNSTPPSARVIRPLLA